MPPRHDKQLEYPLAYSTQAKIMSENKNSTICVLQWAKKLKNSSKTARFSKILNYHEHPCRV